MAQAAHASLGALLKMSSKNLQNNGVTTINFEFEKDSVLDKWLNGIFTKITLGVENDDEMMSLFERIQQENPNIPVALIQIVV